MDETSPSLFIMFPINYGSSPLDGHVKGQSREGAV